MILRDMCARARHTVKLIFIDWKAFGVGRGLGRILGKFAAGILMCREIFSAAGEVFAIEFA